MSWCGALNHVGYRVNIYNRGSNKPLFLLPQVGFELVYWMQLTYFYGRTSLAKS